MSKIQQHKKVVEGLTIEFNKVASFNYVRIIHDKSGFLVANWVRFSIGRKKMLEGIKNNVPPIDWLANVEEIETPENYKKIGEFRYFLATSVLWK